MSQRGSRSTTSQQESRIVSLEKRHAGYGSHHHENVAQTFGPAHVERPHGLCKVIEDEVSLVSNVRQSTGVAKGRALAYIGGIAVRILPLVEIEDLQEENWEKRRKEQVEWFDLIAKSARAREAIHTLLEITFQRSVTTGKPLAITDELDGWKAELDARQG